MNKGNKSNIVIYEDKNGQVELRADIEKDTIWATQVQIATLFDVDVRTINEHLMNIFKTAELDENSAIRKFRIVQNEGGRKVKRDTNFYNLDAIIAVGYRVNSKKATQFRIWATSILRKYLVDGHVLNKRRLGTSPESLIGLYKSVALLESMSQSGRLKGKLTLKLTEDLVPNEDSE
jgi:hypothetical protein